LSEANYHLVVGGNEQEGRGVNCEIGVVVFGWWRTIKPFHLMTTTDQKGTLVVMQE